MSTSKTWRAEDTKSKRFWMKGTHKTLENEKLLDLLIYLNFMFVGVIKIWRVGTRIYLVKVGYFAHLFFFQIQIIISWT